MKYLLLLIKKIIEILIISALLLINYFLLLSLAGCSKAIHDPAVNCQAVTLTYKETGTLIIHWCSVCGEDLERFKSYPKESQIAWCDPRIQVITIGKDSCGK